jgi:hypothetical protein
MASLLALLCVHVTPFAPCQREPAVYMSIVFKTVLGHVDGPCTARGTACDCMSTAKWSPLEMSAVSKVDVCTHHGGHDGSSTGSMMCLQAVIISQAVPWHSLRGNTTTHIPHFRTQTVSTGALLVRLKCQHTIPAAGVYSHNLLATPATLYSQCMQQRWHADDQTLMQVCSDCTPASITRLRNSCKGQARGRIKASTQGFQIHPLRLMPLVVVTTPRKGAGCNKAATCHIH